MTALDVFLHDRRVGTLERLPQARLQFGYSKQWTGEGGAPLSLSLPVRADPFEHPECAPFFEGLLPEGDFLRATARAFHVSAQNPFALLSEIGGECAGAVALGPTDEAAPGHASLPPPWLGDDELRKLLDELPERPMVLMADLEEDDGMRISLAGAHDKFGVLCTAEGIGLTWGKPPSTHILKLPIAHVSDPIANEAYCMALAAETGLDVAMAEPRSVGPHEFLIVRRYDRDPDALPDARLHQEDLCQALGVVPAEKYEGEGGPGVAACAKLLWRASSAPARDLGAFLDALLFNFLIGNHDAHAKNYSLLLDGPAAVRLGPLYDLLCTGVFANSRKKLAMKYGGENRPKCLRIRHLDRLAEQLDVKPAFVRGRAAQMVERVSVAADPARRDLPADFQVRAILDDIAAILDDRCDRLLRTLAEDPA